MLLTELKAVKFDLYDYPDSNERKALSEKIASDGKAVLSHDDIALLDDSDFALIIKEGREQLRKYPLCNTKTAAISKVFLQAHKNEMPETLYKLAEKNLNLFLTKGKSGDNCITTQELYSQEKAAGVSNALGSREKLADADYALVIENSGLKTRLYPINNEHNCKLASEYFSKNLNAMPLHLRHEFAKAVVLKCASQGYNAEIISNDIRSYCNNRLNKNFENEILIRKEKIASKKVHEALDTLLSASKTESLQKIASLLYKLDKEFGLDKLYNKSFSDPYRAVFASDNSGISKTAAPVSIVGEYSIDPATLSAMPYTEPMQQLFSESDFNSIKSDPAAYDALPVPYKQMIKQQSGVI